MTVDSAGFSAYVGSRIRGVVGGGTEGLRVGRGTVGRRRRGRDFVTPEIRKIVLVPRFSSFVGARTFTTPPLSVAGVASATIAAWRGAALGTSVTFSIVVQQSHDLQMWSDLTTLSPSANAEATAAVSFTMSWMRLSITLGGGTPVVNCWAVGDFLPREGA